MNQLQQTEASSLWQDSWQRLIHNRQAMIGGWILIVFILLALVTPWLAPYGYNEQNLLLGASSPSWSHWFGTDILGRDLLTRMLYGGRLSLAVGALATITALFIGVTWGATAGYIGGRVDDTMMRIVDILYALPFIIFIVLLMVVFGRSLILLFIAIGAVEWLTMARIVRAQTQSLRQREFIEAAIAMGLPRSRIIRVHILPNLLGPLVVYATLTMPGVMILEAFLSFIGLGVQPPMSSWGLLISQGVSSMESYPWLLIFPGVAFSTTLFALNFLGDGLRDALDPVFVAK